MAKNGKTWCHPHLPSLICLATASHPQARAGTSRLEVVTPQAWLPCPRLEGLTTRQACNSLFQTAFSQGWEPEIAAEKNSGLSCSAGSWQVCPTWQPRDVCGAQWLSVKSLWKEPSWAPPLLGPSPQGSLSTMFNNDSESRLRLRMRVGRSAQGLGAGGRARCVKVSPVLGLAVAEAHPKSL